MLSLLLLILLLQFLCICGTYKYTAFQRVNGDHVLLFKGGHAYDIPDLISLKELCFNENNVSKISDELYEVLNFGQPLRTLKPENNMIDEAIRVKIDKVVALAPSNFWIERYWLDGHYNGEGAYNPAILKVSPFKMSEKVLMVWRSGDDNSVLEMGWFNFGDYAVEKVPQMSVHPLIIDPDTSSMEDARVIEVNNRTIAVVFSGSFSKGNVKTPGYRGAMQLIAYGTFNDVTGLYDFVDSNGQPTTRWLKYPENQKNWSPFMHQGEVHFFQSINPVHVVKAVKTTTTDTDKILTVETVFKASSSVNLPWDGQYGNHLRGGSAVVMVKGLLLTFFHTEIQLTNINPLKTYFMGAATFCPKSPFQIHSISSLPILKGKYYEGKWANHYCNYVMFPMGVVVDDKEEFLYLSMGYQDRYGIVVKMEIEGLLDSLEFVTPCE